MQTPEIFQFLWNLWQVGMQDLALHEYQSDSEHHSACCSTAGSPEVPGSPEIPLLTLPRWVHLCCYSSWLERKHTFIFNGGTWPGIF